MEMCGYSHFIRYVIVRLIYISTLLVIAKAEKLLDKLMFLINIS
jgi:hypothetical protein